DVYAAAVVLWEMLTARPLFDPINGGLVRLAEEGKSQLERPSNIVAGIPCELDEIVLRGLAKDPAKRFATARDMAAALEACVTPSSQRAVGEWVARTAAKSLSDRAAVLRTIENDKNDYESDARMRAEAPDSAETDETPTLRSECIDRTSSSPPPPWAMASS